MRLLINYTGKLLCGAIFIFAAACGTGDRNKTGADAGETNHENPVMEKQDETGDGYTHETNDATQDAEVGPSPGADTTNTDSTQVTPRMGR